MAVEPLKTIVAPCVFAATGILAVSALVLWPLSFLEGWNSNAPITVMILSAFVLGGLGAHCLDRAEAKDKERFRNPQSSREPPRESAVDDCAFSFGKNI